jgi:hypothetical protein
MADRPLDALINLTDHGDRFNVPWRARVTRVDAPGDRVWVTAPGLAAGFEYGPCDTRGLRMGATTSAEAPDAHSHVVSSPLVLGDSVLLMFAGGDPRDPVIVRRLQED